MISKKNFKRRTVSFTLPLCVLSASLFLILFTACDNKNQSKASPEVIQAFLDSIPMLPSTYEGNIHHFEHGACIVPPDLLNSVSADNPSKYVFLTSNVVEKLSGTHRLRSSDEWAGSSELAPGGPVEDDSERTISTTFLRIVQLPVNDASGKWYLFTADSYYLLTFWDGKTLTCKWDQLFGDGGGSRYEHSIFLHDSRTLHVNSYYMSDNGKNGYNYYGVNNAYYIFQKGEVLNAYDHPEPFSSVTEKIKPLTLPLQGQTFPASYKGIKPLPYGNAYFKGNQGDNDPQMDPFYPFGKFTLADGTIGILGTYSASTIDLPISNHLYLFSPKGELLQEQVLKEPKEGYYKDRYAWQISAEGVLTLEEEKLLNEKKYDATYKTIEQEIETSSDISLTKKSIFKLNKQGLELLEIKDCLYKNDFVENIPYGNFFKTIDGNWEYYQHLFCLPGNKNIGVYLHYYQKDFTQLARIITATASGKIIDERVVKCKPAEDDFQPETLAKRIPEDRVTFCGGDEGSESIADNMKVCNARIHIDDWYYISPDGNFATN